MQKCIGYQHTNIWMAVKQHQNVKLKNILQSLLTSNLLQKSWYFQRCWQFMTKCTYIHTHTHTIYTLMTGDRQTHMKDRTMRHVQHKELHTKILPRHCCKLLRADFSPEFQTKMSRSLGVRMTTHLSEAVSVVGYLVTLCRCQWQRGWRHTRLGGVVTDAGC